MRRIVRRQESERDPGNVILLAPEAGPEGRVDDLLDRRHVGEKRLGPDAARPGTTCHSEPSLQYSVLDSALRVLRVLCGRCLPVSTAFRSAAAGRSTNTAGRPEYGMAPSGTPRATSCRC